MIPTKPTKVGSTDTALGTDAKSYAERQKQKKLDAKKQALKGLEDVASSKEKEQLQSVLEGIVDMIVEQEVEASKDDIFGEFLFGDQRAETRASKEKNTPEEDDLLDSLASWINDTHHTALSSNFEEAWKLVRQGKYEKFLKPDEERPVYRIVHGFNVAKALGLTSNPTFQKKIEDLKNGIELQKVLDNIPFKVDIPISYPPPNKKLQSWGIEPLILQNFLRGGEVNILMKTVPNPSNGKFLLNPYEMTSNLRPKDSDHVAMINMLSTEGEVISFGDVKVQAATAVFISNEFGTVSLRRIIRSMYDLMENENE